MSKKSRPWSRRQRRAIQRRTARAQARVEILRQIRWAEAQRNALKREIQEMIDGAECDRVAASAAAIEQEMDPRLLAAYQKYEEKRAGVLYDDTDDKWDFETKTYPSGDEYLDAKPKPAFVEEMKKRREEMARIRADADAATAHIEDVRERDREWSRIYYRDHDAFADSGWDWRAAEKRRGISTEGTS